MVLPPSVVWWRWRVSGAAVALSESSRRACSPAIVPLKSSTRNSVTDTWSTPFCRPDHGELIVLVAAVSAIATRAPRARCSCRWLPRIDKAKSLVRVTCGVVVAAPDRHGKRRVARRLHLHERTLLMAIEQAHQRRIEIRLQRPLRQPGGPGAKAP